MPDTDTPTTDAPRSTPSTGVMLRLKTETADLHEEAEHHPLQRALAKGQLDRSVFIATLAQMHHLHVALDRLLGELAETTPAIAAVVTDEQYRARLTRADLEHFGVDPDAAPINDETRAAIDWLDAAARREPLIVLGAHYVLEGSNNGGRFIARSLAKAYDLEPGGPGLRTYDPYGDEQRAKWQAFKAAMTEQGFTPEQEDALVEGAKAMFGHIAALSSGVAAREGVD
jgi:heme oxygenase